MNQIRQYETPTKILIPRAVTLVADATFFGKRKDKFGVLVFKDIIKNEILIWKLISKETVDEYQNLLQKLLSLGFAINGVTVDGKKGLFRVFKDYPIQMCQFHQKMIIKRYITRFPKLEASIELKRICTRLKYSNAVRFTKALDIWYLKYKFFLNEESVNWNTGEITFTHKRLVSAYRSLRTNLPYLFTYKNHKNLSIANTTNNIDGGVFSHLKKLTKIHQGIFENMKIKIIDEFFYNYNNKL